MNCLLKISGCAMNYAKYLVLDWYEYSAIELSACCTYDNNCLRIERNWFCLMGVNNFAVSTHNLTISKSTELGHHTFILCDNALYYAHF